LEVRGEEDQPLSEAALTAIVLAVLAILVPIIMLIERMCRKVR
jgi:hypothetical protein